MKDIKINLADKLFKENINKVLSEGTKTIGEKVRPKYEDGTDAHTYFITHVCETYDISKGELPIITLRPIGIRSAIGEILWIYQDASNDLNLLESKYNIKWWKPWEVDNSGTIGQRYGATVKKYNLIGNLLKDLKENPYSRRHIMNLYQYSDLDESDGLFPCAFMTMWSVRGSYLDMTLVQRSSDVGTANHINKVQYVALQMMIARHVGLEAGKFTHYVENYHIYDRHIEQAKELLNRTPSEKQPKLILNPNKTDFYSFTVDDFQLIDYEPVRPQLKFELGI